MHSLFIYQIIFICLDFKKIIFKFKYFIEKMNLIKKQNYYKIQNFIMLKVMNYFENIKNILNFVISKKLLYFVLKF